MEENNDEKEPEIDENGLLIFRLKPTDSALVVRANGSIELISSELAGHENGYLGDIEDLNKTFSLVLALAASIEDEEWLNKFQKNKISAPPNSSLSVDMIKEVVVNEYGEALDEPIYRVIKIHEVIVPPDQMSLI